jgi:hypothetical protein
MNVDWALAIGIFAMFSIWSLVYYTGFFDAQPDISQAAETAGLKTIRFLETPVTNTPVAFQSSQPGQVVLSARLGIPPEEQSGLQVLDSSGSSLPCMLSGDTLYWQDDLSPGLEEFMIRHSDAGTLGCSDTLETSLSNQTYPLTSFRTGEVSQLTLSDLVNVPYENLRASLGVASNIRIEWSGPETGEFGPAAPGNRDVSSWETTRPVLETGEPLQVRVLVWE